MQTTSIKRILYGFNVIFVITGIIMVVVGASVKSHYYPYYTFLDNRYVSLPNMLIATGSLIFFISLLGFYGTMKESWFILMTFSVLLAVIFVFELSVSIAGYVLGDKTSTFLENTLRDSMEHYGRPDDISNMWDVIQEEFQCCGVTNYSDWQIIFSNNSLPISCCPLANGIVGAFYCNSYVPEITTPAPKPTDPPTEKPGEKVKAESDSGADSGTTYPASTTQPYTSGCHSLFSQFITNHAVRIGAVGISIAILQLAGVILSFHLARQLRNSYYST